MDTQLKNWELWIDRLWSAAAIDWHEAARLALDIASAAQDDTLRHAASQGLPSLRNAALWSADDASARRRPRIRMPAATRGPSSNCPRRAMR